MWRSLSVLFGVGALFVCLSFSKSSAAEAIPAGQKIFLDNKCTQCHNISALKIAKAKADKDEKEEEEASEGSKKVDPPDLSSVGKDHKADWFVKWLNKEEKVEGRKHKKKFKGSPESLDTLTQWIATLKYDVPKNPKDKAEKSGKKEKESSDE